MQRTPEECLRISIDALGGLQQVGHCLRPELDPVLAGQWLAHCTQESHSQKLSEAQEATIWRKAYAIGSHAGFQAYAQSMGYQAVPISTDAQLVEAVKRAEAAKREATEAARDLSMLVENPRLLAQMQAAGLKVP